MSDPTVYHETNNSSVHFDNLKKSWWYRASPIIIHYFTLATLGIVSWLLLWLAFGNGWRWDGRWFPLAMVAMVAWFSAQLLQATTTLPPLLAALLVGIIARNANILDMKEYVYLDLFLRKVYPVVILGKASLAWDLTYMRRHWRRVVTLGSLPWAAEVLTMALCTHYLLPTPFPWMWGFLLGTLYASVSCAVVMPSIQRIPPGTRNWPQLFCTAGGMETTLSVGMYGIISTLMFAEADVVYNYFKAALTLVVGVTAGAIWGSFANLLPNSRDSFSSELRVLVVLSGGLLANFFTSQVGWGGAGGVAVLACNAMAGHYWAKGGWKINSNPAATAYRVMWSALEPVLFAYTGTLYVIDVDISQSLFLGFAILSICLVIRLTVAALVCWDMSLREKLLVCFTWTPKAIVEAVLCPLALEMLIAQDLQHNTEMKYATEMIRLSVQAILITAPLGFILTEYLGVKLLKIEKNTENDSPEKQTCHNNAPHHTDNRIQRMS